MKFLSIFLIIFWLIIIIYPEFLAFLIGMFFMFIWLNMFLVSIRFWKWVNQNWDEFVKFWKYVIYKK